MKRLSLAVVQGGPSSEAEVSRASAASVGRALEASGHRVVRLELDVYLAESLRRGGYDAVFPVVHGAVGEDGCLQGLLEILDLPYVGSGVLASALAMNKPMAKIAFAAAGLPLARGLSLPRPRAARASGASDSSVHEEARAAAQRVVDEVSDRVVVKPFSSGSAIGVARFAEPCSVETLAQAILAAWTLDEGALVEAFASGREVTCGVLERGNQAGGEAGPVEALALPPTEIRAPSDAFYTYEARYAPGRSQHLCPAPLDPDVTRRVQDVAVRAHRALGCRDLSRADFVVGDRSEEVTLLEVNTMPGFTETSLFPEAAGVSGVPVIELCHGLVMRAVDRGPARRNAARPLPTP